MLRARRAQQFKIKDLEIEFEPLYFVPLFLGGQRTFRLIETSING